MTEKPPIGGIARGNRPYYKARDERMKAEIKAESEPLPFIAQCQNCTWQVECEDVDQAEIAAGNHYEFMLEQGEVHVVEHGPKDRG